MRALEPLCVQYAESLECKALRSVRGRAVELLGDEEAADVAAGEWRDAARAAVVSEAVRDDLEHQLSGLSGGRSLLSKLLLRQAWWEARIDGAANLPGDVEICGELERTLRCGDCGFFWTVPRMCDRPLLCEVCERKELSTRRKRLFDSIEAAKKDHKDARRRFLTITVPGAGSTADRVRWGLLGRQRLFAELGRELAAQGQAWSWWSRFEATEGADGKGHVHFHAITMGAYVPDPVLCALWGRTLERLGAPVPRRSLGLALERLDWLEARFRLDFGHWRRRLIALARVPWSVPGRAPPRRRRGEGPAGYVARRAAWAAGFDGVAHRSVAQLGAHLAGLEDDLAGPELSEIASVSWLPHAVADIRASRAHSDVRELCKYAIKRWTTSPGLYAEIAFELMRRRARTFVTSKKDGCARPAGAGCVKCGSPNVRPDREAVREPIERRILRLSERIAGKRPRSLVLREA